MTGAFFMGDAQGAALARDGAGREVLALFEELGGVELLGVVEVAVSGLIHSTSSTLIVWPGARVF